MNLIGSTKGRDRQRKKQGPVLENVGRGKW